MKKVRPAKWARPAYSYSYSRGIKKKRQLLPVLLYLLVVSIPMAGAVYAASSQTHARSSAARASAVPASPKFTLAVPAAQNSLADTKSVEYEDNQLQVIMKQFVATHPGHSWSVSLQGLGSDERSAAFNPTTVYNSASVFKLLLMYPLIQRTPIDQWPTVTLNVDGKARTLDACVRAMLSVSDNSCGQAVGNYVGWGYANSQLKLLGLQRTTLNNPNGPETNSADVAFYLRGLYEGAWFDGATRAYIIKTLDQQIFRAGIPAGCGSGCAVADKTGDLGFVRHDAGVVRYAGGAYVLSVFSDGAPYSQIAELTGQLQTFMAAN